MGKKTSQMTPAGTLQDTDLVAVVVDATTSPKSRKATLAQVRGTSRVSVGEEAAVIGLFHTIRFIGSAITVAEESPGIATVTVAEAAGGPASHISEATVAGKPGTPGQNTTLLRFVAPMTMSIPADFTGSRAYAEVPATANTTLYLNKGGVNIGSITFAAGSQVGTFTSTTPGVPVALAAGEWVRLYTGTTQDATLAELGISLLLYK